MIEELKISGFRSLKDVTWRPGRLNVVIGPNGSGKSNLLQVFELLRASALGKLDSFILSEGGFGNVLWDGRANGLTIDLRTTPDAQDEKTTTSLDYGFLLTRINNSASFRIDKESLTRTYLSGKIAGTMTNPLRRNRTFSAVDGLEDSWETETFPPDETTLSQVTDFMNVDSGVQDFKRQLLDLNIFPYLDTSRTSPLRTSSVARFDKHLATDGHNLIPVLHTLYSSDREFKELLDTAMRAALGEDFDGLIFPPFADQRIQMSIRWRSLQREQSTANLSDGTLRFLFLITTLTQPNPPSIIAIDEPETGLHPSMLPIVAEYAVNAALRSQVIFTTHSDLFLDAFNDTWERPLVTVTKCENGETILSTIDGEELKRWLDNFSFGSMYRSGELESGLIG